MSTIGLRIYDDNFIDTDILANSFVTSEQTSFPVSNLYNQNRRSKVWRSNGYWNITSSNNRLVFRESIGVDITAVLNTGEYTSRDSLNTEIQRALNDSTGGSTYTVSTNNLHTRIVSNGSGGGGIFQIIYASSTIADDIGFTSDKTGSLTYDSDKIVIHQLERITWDLGISSNPTSFFAIDQKDNFLKFSKGEATLNLYGNETNAWNSPSFTEALTYDDEILSVISDSGIGDQEYRYWALEMIDKKNPNGYLQLGAVFLGDFLNFTNGKPQYPLNLQYEDLTTVTYSSGGQSYGDIKPKTEFYSFEFFNLRKDEIEEFELFWQEKGIGKPFFVSLDTNEVFSTDKNRRIIFCKFADKPQWTFTRPNLFRLTINLRAEL